MKNLIKWVKCTVSPTRRLTSSEYRYVDSKARNRILWPADIHHFGLRIVVFDLFAYKPVLIGFFVYFRFQRFNDE